MKSGKHLSGLRSPMTSAMRSLSSQVLDRFGADAVETMDAQLYDHEELNAVSTFARARVRMAVIQRLPKRGRRHAVRP